MTEAGRRLLSSAPLVLDRLMQTEEEIRRWPKAVKVAADQHPVLHLLSLASADVEVLQGKFPGVHVQINLEATQWGRPLDACWPANWIWPLFYGPVEDSRMDAHFLFQDEMVAVMSPGHRLAAQILTRRRFCR